MKITFKRHLTRDTRIHHETFHAPEDLEHEALSIELNGGREADQGKTITRRVTEASPENASVPFSLLGNV